MKILEENPPNNLRETIASFGMLPHNGVIYTYGDTIYNPSGIDLPDHLITHEETHCGQQGTDPDAWWDRYLQDQYFRIEQETAAYARQFAKICTRVRDRNQRNRILLDLSRILAGPVYGNVISKDAAFRAIKTQSGVKP